MKLDASSRNKKSTAFASYSSGYYDAQTEIDTVALSPQVVINEKILDHDSKLIAGLDYSRNEENLQNESLYLGSITNSSFELTKENVGVYGNGDISINDHLVASGGFRHDRAEYTALSAGITDSLEMDENLYNAGLTYSFSDNRSTYISYARSFRYPVLDEMFDFRKNTFDNTLGPQTTDDFEIGARVQFDVGLNLIVNLFKLTSENEIFYNPQAAWNPIWGGFWEGSNMNMDGDTIRQGVELKASQKIAKVLLRGSYTLRVTEIDGGQYDGKEIPNVPTHQFTLGAETELCKRVRLNVEGSYIGERPYISDFNNAFEDNDAYLYAAAKLAYLFENGSAYVSVKNLFNEEYSEFGGLDFNGNLGGQPSPKINFLLGVDLVF